MPEKVLKDANPDELAEMVRPEGNRRREYVLLPNIGDTLERLEWRAGIAIGASQAGQTIGHSADEAGAGPSDRWVTAVNPQRRKKDLSSWYEEHYPGVLYRAIVADAPWEVAIHLLAGLREDIALAQRDPRWEDCDFGDEPGTGTIGGCGGLLTGIAIILRKIYQRSVTPPLLDKLLVTARAAFVDGHVLVWKSAVSLFSAFDGSVRDDRRRSADQLETLLEDDWEIILRGLGGSEEEQEYFAYLERVEGDLLHVIDTRDGTRQERTAADFQGIRAAHVKRMPTIPSFERLGGDVEQSARPALASYDHTYVLLPWIEDEVTRLEWRVAAAVGSAGAMHTVGHLPGDVDTRPPCRRLVAVNPDQLADDLKTWHTEHGSSLHSRVIEALSPWEMAVKLLPRLKEDIALAQRDSRWERYDFGEHPTAGPGTIGRYGCFLTGLAIILRRIYRRDVNPPVLDKLLVAARSAYVNDNLMAWQGAVPLFPAFDGSIKDNRARSALELRELLDEGWEVILRRADGEHFVYLEDVEGDTLHVIDPWDGKRKRKAAGGYLGIRAAHVTEDAVHEVAEVLVGLHDEAGGEWMVDRGMLGCCLVHRQIQRQPIRLDFTHLSEAGIVVLGRLNWGYADGTGTLPASTDREAFVEAVVETMRSARGVDYFHVGSEPNNPREWPALGSENPFVLTPEYVTEIYNDIWQAARGEARLGPPPIDPYYGPESNNRAWWTYILEHIHGADVLFLHAKTQTNDPAEVWSRERFSDWPLEWQYRHLATVETGLEVVPDRFWGLPVFVSQLNPQCLRTPGGDVGWLEDNAEWVHEAVRYFREQQPVTGVTYFRYNPGQDQASFGLADKPIILDAIRREGETEPSGTEKAVSCGPPGLAPGILKRLTEARD